MKPKDLNLWHIPLGIVFAVVFLALLMCSCKTVEYVPVIEQRTDTLVQKVIERDSIHVHDSTIVREAGDTVLIERWHYLQGSTKAVRVDTLFKVDSVQVPVEVKTVVTKTEQVDKPLHWWQRALMLMGGLALIVGALWVAIKVRKI